MSNNYKELQRQAYSSNTGSNIIEVLLLTIWIPLAHFASSFFVKPFFPSSLGVLVDFTTLIPLQILLFLDCFSPSFLMVLFLSLFLCLISIRHIYVTGDLSNDDVTVPNHQNKEQAREALTNFRASVMILSVIAILAVDFQQFPRRFAKTETTGTSLMDAGVGTLIVGMGLSTSSPSSSPNNNKRTPLKKLIRKVAPVVLLGIGRACFVEFSQYQHNPSEYGVHWNFFLTLSALPCINWILLPLNPLAVGAFVGVAYQIMLTSFGFGDWVNEEHLSYKNIIYANKEGILSLLGYTSLLHLARSLRKGRWRGTDVPVLLMLYSILPFKVSRRQCNLPFIVGSLLLSLLHLRLFELVASVCNRHCIFTFYSSSHSVNSSVISTSSGNSISISSDNDKKTTNKNTKTTIFSLVSDNQLVFFLLANILTGLVNMSIETLLIKNVKLVFGILLAYITLAFIGCYLFEIFFTGRNPLPSRTNRRSAR